MSSGCPSPSDPVGAGRREAVRLSLAYVALFGVMGVHLPYWPVWLAYRGMEPDQIGVLLGVFTWARLTAPWAGSWVDRGGHAGVLASRLAVAHMMCFAAFAVADGFVPLLLLSAVAGLSYAPIVPLIDGIAVGAAAAGRLDYGHVRLWGSAAFVLASSAAGLGLQGRSPSLVLAVLLVASAGLCAATWWLPRTPVQLPVAGPGPAARVRELLMQPGMRTLLATVACIQGSHAVLYGFGTRHWQAIGIGESAIGWLWAWGVIVEVALFAVGRGLVARIRPNGLLVVAAVGGLVRWPLLARVESFEVIIAVQTLHAATFAAMHLGALSWIRDTIHPGAVQRATALYVAVATGIAIGVGMPLAGVLFERFAGQAYDAMAVVSGVGVLFALRLLRRQSAALAGE